MSIFQTEPFARYECQTTAPQQLGGYIIDLLDELSESVSDVHLHFDVTPVADGKYGDFVERNWNGMMGEITGSRPVSKWLLAGTVVRLFLFRGDATDIKMVRQNRGVAGTRIEVQ